MKGLNQMIFDQRGARNVFRLWVEKRFFLDKPIVKSVRMTRGGKFIVEIEDEQTHSTTKTAAAEINSQKREEVGASSQAQNGAYGNGVDKDGKIIAVNNLSNVKTKSITGNL